MDARLTAGQGDQLGAHSNFTFFGEFNGVTEQIEQYLANTAGVAKHLARHLRHDLTDQFKIFFVSPQGQCFKRFGDNAMEIEGNFLDLQLASLDL